MVKLTEALGAPVTKAAEVDKTLSELVKLHVSHFASLCVSRSHLGREPDMSMEAKGSRGPHHITIRTA